VTHGDEQIAALNIDENDLTFGRSVSVEIPLPAGGRSKPITVAEVE
jgi:hypothetical protein